MLLSTQVRFLTLWADTRRRLVEFDRDDRGEVTAQMVFIVLVVAAAVTVGGIVAAKMIAEAESIDAG